MASVTSVAAARRRNRFQIKVDLLHALKLGENKPTRLMYASGVAWASFQEVISGLIELGLIEKREVEPGERGYRKGRIMVIYSLTDHGEKVYRDVKKVMCACGEGVGRGFNREY